EKPYFLMGSTREPVYLWRWESTGSAVEAVARGLDRIEPLPADAQGLSAQASFTDGEWQVVLRRSLDVGEHRDRLGFATGTAVPIAFFAWDGSNGEAGTRGSISTWDDIHLREPTPAAVY